MDRHHTCGPRAAAHRAFADLGLRLGRTPRRHVIAIAALTALFVAQIPRLRVDTTFEGMLPASDPARLTYESFREQFGSTERAFLAVRAPDGIFQPRFMEQLAALHEDLEHSVPMLDSVTSLVNARWTRGEDDRLVVQDFMAEWPEDAEAWAEREQRALANPLYRDLFVSRDGGWTLVIVEPDPYADITDHEGSAADLDEGFGDEIASPASTAVAGLSTDEMVAITRAVKTVASRYRAQGLEIRVGGGVVMGALLGEGIERDFGLLLALAMALIALLLFVVFRRWSRVVLVLSVVLLSLAGALGAMAWLDVPLDVGTQILPAFLLAVGVGYAVHVLTIFEKRYRETGDKRAAVTAALEHVGPAIVMTAVTTMGGLFAFAFAGLVPLERIGLFAPIGVLFCVVFSLILLPALLILMPIAPPPRKSARMSRAASWLVRVGEFSVSRRRAILIVLAALVGLSAVGISRVRVSHNPLEWLPADSDFRRANRVLDEEFGGGYQVELLVRARDGHTFREPELLKRLDALAAELLTVVTEDVAARKVLGLHDIAKEIHQALHGDDPTAYGVTDDAALLVQELLLFENGGSDDLERLTDASFQTSRLSIRVNYADAYAMTPYIDRLDRVARQHLSPIASVEATGLFAISHRVFSALVDSMLRSYLIALVIIGVCMILMIGSVREGLVALIPNLAPIVLTLGFMGFAGIPLGIFTLLVGNIALGIAVDDTIHFVQGYVRDRNATGDAHGAVRRTLETTGSALLFTSTALVVGFSVFVLASLENLMAFGLLASLSIVLAFLADVLVSPGLMVAVSDRSRHRVRAQRAAAPLSSEAAAG